MHYGRTYLMLLLTVLGLCGTLTAQEQPESVEDASYRLYLSGDWKKLAAYCDSAIASGTDYYYLSLRAGIARYQLQQYRTAIGDFDRARKFNSVDTLAVIYEYYSYVFAGQYEEATWFRSGLDSLAQSKLHESQVSVVYGEGAMKRSDDSLYADAFYGQVGLTHTLGGRASLSHAATIFAQKEYRYNIHQYQYYLRPVIPMRNNFSLALGLHLVYDDLLLPPTVLPRDTLHPWMPPPVIPGHEERYWNIAGAAQLTKHTEWFDFSIGATTSYIDSSAQQAGNAGLVFFPLRNNRLSIGVSGYFHTDDQFTTTYGAFSSSLDAVFSKYLYGSVSYMHNSGPNFIENVGYFVNNSDDNAVSRFSAGLTFRPMGKVAIYGTYAREERYNTSLSSGYNYNIFLFGLKFFPAGAF